MLILTCEEVSMKMPESLRRRVEQEMIRRAGSDVTKECHYVVTGESVDEVLDQATMHVKEAHTMRSWPPEYWVHMRACIREAT